MYNGIMGNFQPMPHMPNQPNMGIGNLPMGDPNGMFINMNGNQEIRNMEMRISNLEREVNRLKHRISKMDNGKDDSNTPNYGINYQPNSYNMM